MAGTISDEGVPFDDAALLPAGRMFFVLDKLPLSVAACVNEVVAVLCCLPPPVKSGWVSERKFL